MLPNCVQNVLICFLTYDLWIQFSEDFGQIKHLIGGRRQLIFYLYYGCGILLNAVQWCLSKSIANLWNKLYQRYTW